MLRTYRAKRLLVWLAVVTASITIPFMLIRTSIDSLDSRLAYSGEQQNGTDLLSEEASDDIITAIFNETSEIVKVEEVPPFMWCVQPDEGVNDSSSISLDKDTINCDRLFLGDKLEIHKARSWTPPCAYSERTLLNLACDCSLLKSRFHFSSNPLTQEELRFPLAFVLIANANAEQVIRLLASIYQPQNAYCLTYDKHVNEEFKRTMDCVIKCFRNIVSPEEHFEIYWADISILDATTACIKKLVSLPSLDWRYLQILSWNDLPLKTNAEMVRIFKTLNGSCDSELIFGQPDRFRKYHIHGDNDQKKVGIKRSVPPDGLTMYKGSYAVSLTRDFCQFLINDPVAQRLYSFSRPAWAPEEQFWSTLIHNPGLNHQCYFPGTCLHYYHLEHNNKDWISRYQVWDGNCAGQVTSGSCCFGVGDLKKLKSQRPLIAHKFYSDFEPATWYCMLKWNHEKTYNTSVAAKYPLDMNYYENMPSVRYKRSPNKDEFAC